MDKEAFPKLELINTEDDIIEQDALPYEFGFPIRPALRLGYVESILQSSRVLLPVPSRGLLIRMIQSGELEGKKVGGVWIIYEDSFLSWVRSVSLNDVIQSEQASA